MKKVRPPRYKNEKFMTALGAHCQSLRLQKGYSIDRMYREGEQLSTSVIHRLENGSADTQISVFYRYAQVLGLELRDLFDFDVQQEISGRILPYEEGVEKPKGSVPYYSLKVAAGRFEDGRFNSEEPAGWVPVKNHKNLNDCFAAYATGKSMEPSIPNGSLCLFRLYQGGTRQNRIFLIRTQGKLDPESDAAFVVKKYRRMSDVPDTQNRSQVLVHLLSENKAYPPIVLAYTDEKQIDVIAELIDVIA